jgi:hypothetical protein
MTVATLSTLQIGEGKEKNAQNIISYRLILIQSFVI